MSNIPPNTGLPGVGARIGAPTGIPSVGAGIPPPSLNTGLNTSGGPPGLNTNFAAPPSFAQTMRPGGAPLRPGKRVSKAVQIFQVLVLYNQGQLIYLLLHQLVLNPILEIKIVKLLLLFQFLQFQFLQSLQFLLLVQQLQLFLEIQKL